MILWLCSLKFRNLLELSDLAGSKLGLNDSEAVSSFAQAYLKFSGTQAGKLRPSQVCSRMRPRLCMIASHQPNVPAAFTSRRDAGHAPACPTTGTGRMGDGGGIPPPPTRSLLVPALLAGGAPLRWRPSDQ